jgi:cytochrome b561
MSAEAPKLRLNNVFKQLMSLHWWMAICYLLLFPTGIMMAKLDWRGYLLVRVWGRKYRKHLPKFTGNWYFKTGLHTLLYLMMFIVPLTGYWLSNAHQANNISLFGIPMPNIFPVNSDATALANAAHGATSKVFAIFILIHTIAQRRALEANWRRLSAWLVTFKGR